MGTRTVLPRLKGYHYPCAIIAYAVWAWYRFTLSTADFEYLLAKRGIIVRREAIRLWVKRFGSHSANCIQREQPCAAGEWYVDHVVVPISGVKYCLCRAVNSNGDVLDSLVQTQRNAKVALRVLSRLTDRFGEPHVVITPLSRHRICDALPGNGQIAKFFQAHP